ncbi:MAG: hypothetical protein M3O90_09770 [Actinomycetota bacterium]|nr:hypothetical protein [Actinomycetota bacterium]
MRRLAAIIVPLGLLAGATALAQDGGPQGPYDLQEPAVSSADVLKLPSDVGCVHFTLATARVLPPPGAVFGDLRVNVAGRQVTRLTGVPRAASVTVRIGRGRTDVTVRGTTLGGQTVGAQRSYRRCSPTRRRRPAAPAPPAPPPSRQVIGGGEDG